MQLFLAISSVITRFGCVRVDIRSLFANSLVTADVVEDISQCKLTVKPSRGKWELQPPSPVHDSLALIWWKSESGVEECCIKCTVNWRCPSVLFLVFSALIFSSESS